MSSWSFEVRHGHLDTIPASLANVVEEQKHLDAECFLLAEAGILLNEPEDKLIASIPKQATPHQVIAGLAHACSWLFGSLETEIDQHFRWNYLKFSFVNLNPIHSHDASSTGIMTTNAPELPAPSEQPSTLMMNQLVTALRDYFSHLRGSTEISDFETDLYRCDWVTMTFSKAS